MKRRNYYMVDHSCVCVYYMVHSVRSGTAQTVAYARKKNARLIDLTGDLNAEYLPEEEEEKLSKAPVIILGIAIVVVAAVIVYMLLK